MQVGWLITGSYMDGVVRREAFVPGKRLQRLFLAFRN